LNQANVLSKISTGALSFVLASEASKLIIPKAKGCSTLAQPLLNDGVKKIWQSAYWA